MNYDDSIRVEYFPEAKRKFRVVIRDVDGRIIQDLGFYETPAQATVVAVKNRNGRKVWQSNEVQALLPKETSE